MADDSVERRGPARPYRKGVERRRQILDRAIELFAEHGVDGASMRSVGDAIGVSHAALRHYFTSREELLIEVYREHEQRLLVEDEDTGAVEDIARSADRNREVPGLVQLYATLTADALQEQRAATREFVNARFRRVREDLVRRIERSQAAGTTPADIDASDAASLIVAASDGLQVQWLLDPGTVDVRRSLELLERFLPSGS
ncbi:AcrR family transcriptional regulator [Kineococcus radiotolerans]|uniref:Transcriptional regulator, TetR family n=2 Tax=Kineococcus radiotolerans TaxID=131568 RepID=A6WEE4_KINRD|nr:TetR/AcrR family transcriptional regulator [Kineococcus radiotolerans]ABS05183.1 transcriptional regulator, TetR family [Kineococcus radiotolerans SRS30216 = ATCC BAA-149]MBB2902053.1 AcrR family transcriptional regulator [Kineococcus radiotolerans]